MMSLSHSNLMSFFFFFNDTATTEIYTLSLHDALPIYMQHGQSYVGPAGLLVLIWLGTWLRHPETLWSRSEEHTSELQSQSNLVCRLLLEKKKINFSPSMFPKTISNVTQYTASELRNSP